MEKYFSSQQTNCQQYKTIKLVLLKKWVYWMVQVVTIRPTQIHCSKQSFYSWRECSVAQIWSNDSQFNILRTRYRLILSDDGAEVCGVFVSGRGRGWWWWILAINCITPPRSCRNIRHNPVLAQRHNTLTHRYPYRISRTPLLCSWSSQGIDTLQMRRE